jgi:hypothetical protein
MPDPKLIEFTAQSFTAEKLEIKVKNISGKVLDDTLAIELFVPAYLANSKVNDAAKKAATNLKPIGVAGLEGVVTGPASWSVWAKRETSDSSVVILLLNDLTQTGTELSTPIKLDAGAEFVIGIPLNPQANRAAVNVVYNYQHGTANDQRGDGKLELKGDVKEDIPNVTLTTTHKTPTAVPPGDMVKIFWHIENGVSATLRGPLPGGNGELPLDKPNTDFKMADGFIEVRVVSNMTFILQAEVKRQGKPNIEVTRMLFLDTTNEKFTYVSPRPSRVLPYGLIEIDWAAWGAKQVDISVSGHTTRTIQLTQQTLGRFYEGSGVMRVNATKTINKVITKSESIMLQAPPADTRTQAVEVIPWIPMDANIDSEPTGMAVIAPMIGVVTPRGLYVAEVGEIDTTPPQEKLEFTLKTTDIPNAMWTALTAVDQRFVGLLLILQANPVVELRPFKLDGSADEIPPVTLPDDLRPIAFGPRAVFDLVGFGGRAYFVAESPRQFGSARRAYSVGFNTSTKKADLRPEPMLDVLTGYRLVSFDDALYALNRTTGQMLRFELTKTGTLDSPRKAASAVKKGEGGAKDEPMIGNGLLVPVGRLLVVMSPATVPTVASLEQYGLHNTLKYTSSAPPASNIPQDLFYNPQKNYWGRCGHDLDVKPDWPVAYRGGESKRLWVIAPNSQIQTLAVGLEALFAPDYVTEFPTKALPPYLNKQRQFKITNSTGMHLTTLDEPLRKGGLTEFSANGLTELASDLPENFQSGKTETVELKYHDAEPIPVTLRFQVQTGSGIKHFYFLELTFSGPDLATATSVFKRAIIGDGNRLSIAEIPGTLTQHKTNDPIVIPPPKRLLEGVTLRARNASTFRIWLEVPQARRDEQWDFQNRYSGEDIKINFDTPSFYFLAYGAGELHVDVDFALPPGLEKSPGSEPQRQLLRINTDKSTGLHADIDRTPSQTSFECKLSYLRKQELNGVYIGDGMARERGEAIFLPVARHDIQALAHILKIDPDNLAVTQSADFQSKNSLTYNVFATPNSIAVSNELIYAMFADKDVQVLDFSLQLQDKVSVDEYTVVTGMKNYYGREYFLLGMKQEGANAKYTFRGKNISKNTSGPRKISTGNGRTISLDAVKGFRDQNKIPGSPAWVSSKTVSPMAVSPVNVSPRGERDTEVAVCIDGGLFVIGSTEQSIRTLALDGAHREEDIVFGREGKHIYCLHSESDGIGLRVTRVDNTTWKQTHSLSLQTGPEKAPDLTTDTRQQRPAGIYKSQRAISMVCSLDGKLLFVSHGRTIFKIDAATMSVIGVHKMELPCRVFHVWGGKPSLESHPFYGTPTSCTLLYAIGATYKGNGFDGREFQTHLYKIGIPD